jgi:uncharacterized protein (TIGR00645 family)
MAVAIFDPQPVQLLKAYLKINAIANDKLLWLAVIHLTFVVSALLLTVMDRLLGAAARH